MERNAGIRSIVLILVMTLFSSCSYKEQIKEEEIVIKFSGKSLMSKTYYPEEEMVSDISLMIFDENGSAEECFWLEDGTKECSARLIVGKRYIFCACANLGHQVYADDIGELEEFRFHMAYPDDYRNGIPMYARQEVTIGEGCGEVTVALERLMAKISLRMDRRRLSDDVEMYVRSVRIGNCPRSSNIFSMNKAADEDECFPAGFSLYGEEVSGLNRTSESGVSGTVSLYMLENMQGKPDRPIDKDSDKIFDEDDHRSKVCSYIELELDYLSDDYLSLGKGLIYRFYLGGSRNDLNVERNCHYHITVAPEDDGLKDDGWRVDKSALVYCGPTGITGHPDGYIVGDIGDKIHIWCELTPEDAPFDVGLDDMEFDKANGVYDYEIDEDGHGATLTLTGPGTGLIYMEAGPPINDGVLFYIEVNLPENSGQELSYDVLAPRQECKKPGGNGTKHKSDCSGTENHIRHCDTG